MMMLHLLTVLACSGIVIAGKEELYPNFACHPGFNNKTERILDTMKECKPKKECYKSCILNKYYILLVEDQHEYKEIKLMQPGTMIDYLCGFLFDYWAGCKSGNRIGDRILADCGELVEKLKNAPCVGRQELYTCMEKAWACDA